MTTSFMETGCTNQDMFRFLSKLTAPLFGEYPMLIYKVGRKRGKAFAINLEYGSPGFMLRPEDRPIFAALNFRKDEDEQDLSLEYIKSSINDLNNCTNKETLFISNILKLKLKNIVEMYETVEDGQKKMKTICYQDRSVMDVILNSKGQFKLEIRGVYSLRNGDMIKIWDYSNLVPAGPYSNQKLATLCAEVLLNGTIDLLEDDENETI